MPNQPESILSACQIVLVEPTHPGNIGAVARSMKTMGLHDLVLVNPKKFPHYEASKRAAGGESVLDRAKVVPHFNEAISDSTLVIGTSVRDREVSWPTVNPRQAADKVVSHLADFKHAEQTGKISIVFGRESSGLSNDELEQCQLQLRIDANPEYSSLNLASAVQIICYDLRMQALENCSGPETIESDLTAADKRKLPATKQMQDGHLEHLQNMLQTLDFIKSESPTVLFRKLARLYAKSELSVEEVQILRGIYTAIESKVHIKT